MALHRAIIQGRAQQVKYLLTTRNCTNNSINAKYDGGKTPLILTCEIDRIKIATCIARLLLKSGAKVGIPDDKGRNALSHACICRRHELVKLFLRQVDYNLNMLDVDGNSPLHHAAIAGDVDIVTVMVREYKKNHSSVDIPNKLGETPLMIASRLGFLACAEVLITIGLASLTKRDNINFMNALEWAQTNEANNQVNLSSIYCSRLNNSLRSNSALSNCDVDEQQFSECDINESEEENAKSMVKCLTNAYRIYEVQNSKSYRVSTATPVKSTPSILTSFFDFHKDGTYSIEDVMWLVRKNKKLPKNVIPKSLIRRHTDSRLSPHVAKSPHASNASVLDSLSLDLDSRLHDIHSVNMDSDTSDSEDTVDEVFYSIDPDKTDGKHRQRHRHRHQVSYMRERHDSGIPESTTADSSDDQLSEKTVENTSSDFLLAPSATKQRLAPYTDIRILKSIKSPETTKRLAVSTDGIFLRPESSPLRQHRVNSDSALDTKAFKSRSDSALDSKALSSPSIARWQNAVSEIRNKIQNNVRFNLESKILHRANRPQTGTATRTNSAPTRKDTVCRRNSESNKYSTQIQREHVQEFTRNSQSTAGRNTRSRNKKIILDSPGSTTTGHKPKKENRREWKRQQEVESEKRRNDLNRKIDSLRSELGKMDARRRVRKYHPKLPENMFSGGNIYLENTNRRTPSAHTEDEMDQTSDVLQKAQCTNSCVDVRFNAFDSRMSWAGKCPTESSLTSSISLPSLGWSSSSEDLLRSDDYEKEKLTCSDEVEKLQIQGRRQRLRQISSIRRPAQAPNQIVSEPFRKQADYNRYDKLGYLTDTKTLKIAIPGNLHYRGKARPGSQKRYPARFQQHP